jgi:hypothetical protein
VVLVVLGGGGRLLVLLIRNESTFDPDATIGEILPTIVPNLLFFMPIPDLTFIVEPCE